MMAQPFRIAMVGACPFPTGQGSQVLIHQLAEALAHRGHAVIVLAYHFGGSHPLVRVPILRTPRLPGYRKFASGPAWGKLILDPLLAVRLWCLARRRGIDLIHAHGYEAALAALAVGRRAGVPVVYHGHGALEDELPSYTPGTLLTGLARWIGRAFDASVPRRANHCITLTPALRARLVGQGGVPLHRATWLPPGIAFESAPPELIEPTARRLGLDRHLVVLYTGNFDRYQRLDLLLAALPTLFARIPTARMVFASHGPPPNALAFSDPRVVVIPHASFEEIRALHGIAAVAVVPRTCPYGFPIKLLNALAAGTPTVAFRQTVPFLAQEPPALMLVDEPSPVALGAAVATLLMDRSLRAQLSVRGRALVHQRFDWGVLTEALEQIYSSVADRPRAFAPDPEALINRTQSKSLVIIAAGGNPIS